jgi:serine/threonine protein kinase
LPEPAERLATKAATVLPLGQLPPPVTSESNAEERAFLQTRVALFWKVCFFIVLLGSGLGAIGAVKKPGLDLVLTLASCAQAGIFWQVCRRGERSIRFSRAMDGGGVVLNSMIGALLGRYILAGFGRDHAIVSEEVAVMADGYISMMQLFGMAMMIAIRAALVPSRPRRTILITAVFAAPMILVTTFLVPAQRGGVAWRTLESGALPWLPVTSAMMWGFTILTCAVISWVIYGLRVEVRKAHRLGQYTLEEKIGEGGMGVVYRATHSMLRRPAAIKLLLPDRAGANDLARFEREVQLTSQLTHPHTISIFDYGRTADGVFYYVMEYLDGFDLERLVDEDGPLAPARAIRILAQASGALSEAHARGLIHRDIKPANIILTRRADEPDIVKVVDFGLVKTLETAPGDAAVTNVNAIIGTPMYLAPEAIASPDSVDPRSDLYSLGAVGYFLLTGQSVFDAATTVEVCSKHLLEAPVPPSQRLGRPVPPDLEAIILACLAKRREDRPASAEVMRAALLACADAGEYDLAAARTWWERRGPELRLRSKERQTAPHEPRVTVQLREREPTRAALEPG